MKFVVLPITLVLLLVTITIRADDDDSASPECCSAPATIPIPSKMPIAKWYRNATFYNLMMLQVSGIIVSKPQTPLLGAKAARNGISTESMGAILALMPLSSALLGPFLGQHLPRIGIRPATVVAVIIMSASGAAFALLDFVRGPVFVAIAIALRVIFGLGQATMAMPTTAYWNATFDNFSTVHSASSTTSTFIGMLVPVLCALLASHFGYAVSLIAFGALSALIGACSTTALPADLPLQAASDGGGRDLLGLLRTVPQIMPALIMLVANMAMAGLIGILVPFVFAAMNVSEVAISAVFSVSAAAWASGMHLSSHLLDDWHCRPAPIMLIGTFLSVIAIAMMVLLQNPTLVTGAVALLSLSTSLAQIASAFMLVTETKRYNQGLVSLTSGLKHAARTGGEAVGNLLGGVLYHRFSLQTTAVSFSAFSAAAMCALAISNVVLRWRPEEQPLPQSVPSSPPSTESEPLLSVPLLEKSPSPTAGCILRRLIRRFFR